MRNDIRPLMDDIAHLFRRPGAAPGPNTGAPPAPQPDPDRQRGVFGFKPGLDDFSTSYNLAGQWLPKGAGNFQDGPGSGPRPASIRSMMGKGGGAPGRS